MSTQQTELPDCQERVGLKRKLTGPPRLLLGKSKSKEKLESKSQRRQRQAKCCDGTIENNDQEEENYAKHNESSHITHHSPQKASEERESQPDAPENTSGILVTLDESEPKDENIQSKIMTRSASKASIKRTFSSLLGCGKRKGSDRTENDTLIPQETKKNRNKAENNMYNFKLSDADSKDVLNGKNKKKIFFTMWPISKRSANVSLAKGCKEQGGSIVFREITAPKGLTFKKIYRIFPRRNKAPPIDQFECSAPNATQNEVADQLNQSATVMGISGTKKEEKQKEEQEMRAECHIPETLTFRAEVSVKTNIHSDRVDEEQDICPDQDMSTGKENLFDSEVQPACFSGCNFDSSELPSTSSGGVLNEVPTENYVKRRPVITIERAYSSEEENLNEVPQFDGLMVNGSWQHLQIKNTLCPSGLNVSPERNRVNETLLIQTAISMVQAAIRGAVEQLTIEQQHNQIS